MKTRLTFGFYRSSATSQVCSAPFHRLAIAGTVILCSFVVQLTNAAAVSEEDWSKWSFIEKRNFARNVIERGTNPEKLAFIQFCHSQFAREMAAEGEIDPNWTGLANTIRRGVSDDERGRWLKAVQAEKSVERWSVRKVFAVDAALRKLGVSPPDAARHVLRWAEHEKRWQSLEADGLASFVDVIGRQDDSFAKWRRVLPEWITSKFVTGEGQAPPASPARPGNWVKFTSVLGKELSVEQRLAWIKHLESRISDDQVAAMSDVDVIDFGRSLADLGARSGDPALQIDRWLKLNAKKWKAYDFKEPGGFDEFVGMALRIKRLGPSASASLATVMDYAEQQYLSKPDGSQLATSEGLSSILYLLGGQKPDRRARWGSAMLPLFTTQARLAQLTPKEALATQEAFRSLTGRRSSELILSYLSENLQWKRDTETSGLVQLAKFVDQDSGPEAQKAVAVVLGHYQRSLEKSSNAAKTELDRFILKDRDPKLAEMFKKQPKAMKDAWIDLLVQTYTAPEIQGSLSVADAIAVQAHLNGILGAGHKRSFIDSYVLQTDKWKQNASFEALIQLVMQTTQVSDAVNESPARDAVLKRLSELQANDPAAFYAWLSKTDSFGRGQLIERLRQVPGIDTSAWAQSIEKFFAQPDRLAKMTVRDVIAAEYLVERLRGLNRSQLIHEFLRKSDAWKNIDDLPSLLQLAETIAVEKEAEKNPDRNLILDFASSALKDEPEKAAKAFGKTPAEVVAPLSRVLRYASKDRRDNWADLIHRACSLPEVRRSLSVNDAMKIQAGINSFHGARETHPFIDAYVLETQAWKEEASFGFLLQLAAETTAISKTVPESPARDRVLKHLSELRARDPNAFEAWFAKADMFGRGQLVERLRQVPGIDTSAWAQSIERFFAQPDRLAKMTVAEVIAAQKLVARMSNHGGSSLIHVFLEKSDVWKSVDDLPLLLQLAETIAVNKETKESPDRDRVLDFALTQFRDHPEKLAAAFAKASIGTLGQIMRATSASTKERKAEWAQLIHSHYVSPDVAKKVSAEDAIAIQGIIHWMIPRSSPSFVDDYIVSSKEWQSVQKLAVLVRLATLTSVKPTTGRADARQVLTDFLLSRYVSRLDDLSKDVAALSFEEHKGLLRALNGAAGDRTPLWGELMRSVYSDPKMLSKFSPAELFAVQAEMKLFGGEHRFEVVYRYILDTKRWQEASPGQLISLARVGIELEDELGTEARDRVADFIYREFVLNTKNREKLSKGDLKGLASVAHLAPESLKQEWAKGLLEAELAGRNIRSMSANDVNRLTRSLGRLDRELGESIAYEYITTAKLKDVDMGTLYRIGSAALMSRQLTKESRVAIGDAIEAAWREADKKGPQSIEVTLRLSGLWDFIGDQNKVDEWLDRGYQLGVGTEEARKAISLYDLQVLGYYLIVNDKARGFYSQPHKEFTDFAQAIVQSADAGTLKEAPKPDFLAYPVSSPESLSIVKSALLDSQGVIRPGVARVLTHVYLNKGTLEGWRSELDQMNASATGDAKALGLLSRAYAQSPSEAVAPILQQRSFLDSALQAAESEAVRLQVLEQYVAYFGAIDRPDIAVSLLNQQVRQFTGNKVDSFNALRIQTELAANKQREAQEKELRRQTQAKHDRAIQLMIDSIRRAVADGDTRKADKLKQQLEQLKKEGAH